MKKIQWKYLLISLAIPLGIGALSALLTMGSFKGFYSTITTPPLNPPSILFPIVWTILYLLMGISSYLVYVSYASKATKRSALEIYFFQLLVNFVWPIIFFNYRLFLVAFVWILLLIFLVVFMIIRFFKASKTAALLQIPYLLWITFASYLNLAIFILNI